MRYREREHIMVHRNEKLCAFYDTLSEQEMTIAIRTVNYIEENFPKTREELLGEKLLDSTRDF